MPARLAWQLLEALIVAVEAGLRLSLVYNMSAYDSMESLRLLEGVVDNYKYPFATNYVIISLNLFGEQ